MFRFGTSKNRPPKTNPSDQRSERPAMDGPKRTVRTPPGDTETAHSHPRNVIDQPPGRERNARRILRATVREAFDVVPNILVKSLAGGYVSETSSDDGGVPEVSSDVPEVSSARERSAGRSSGG